MYPRRKSLIIMFSFLGIIFFTVAFIRYREEVSHNKKVTINLRKIQL